MVVSTDRRIVVGVDGSESSGRALAWAADHADATGSVLEVITTWEWPTNYGWAVPFPEGWDPRSDAQKVQDQAVEPVHRTHPSVTVRSTLAEGNPAAVLVKASQGADLLVVGSRGHTEFAGMLLGSVSEHCVTSAHCPVLVMRD